MFKKEAYILEISNPEISTVEINQNRELEIQITELKKELTTLRAKADRDELTQCLRRQAFLDLIDKRKKIGFLSQRHCLVVADVNKLKYINDHFGHLAGDLAIQHIARALTSSAPDGSLIARFGGDEFVLLLSCDMSEGKKFLNNLQNNFETCPLKVGSALLNIDASIGIAEWNVHEEDFGEAFERADRFMYEEKFQKSPNPGPHFKHKHAWAQKILAALNYKKAA